MQFTAKTIDDLMHQLLKELLARPFDVNSRRGTSSEIIAPTLILTNPLARLSQSETRGKPFSALGEFLWYMSGTNELGFIEYYLPRYEQESEDGKTVPSAYGPRLFNADGKYNQLQEVIKLLKERPHSRNAIIQIYLPSDIHELKYPPCTCSFQFLIRDKSLQMVVHMRSNDAYWGLPHDIFAFTMIQELIARSLEIKVGSYFHTVGSLHLYRDRQKQAMQYLKEGYQGTTKSMPSMPVKDPWNELSRLLKIEKAIRRSESCESEKHKMDSYWKDLGSLLQIHALFKKQDLKGIDKIQNSMNFDFYRPYIENRFL